jgi:hypothetical protein
VKIIMKKVIALMMVLALFALTVSCTQYHAQGAGAAGAVGATAGAMLDKKNPWRGGVIGAALGALAGATLTDVSMRASQQAATANRPTEYRTNDGRGIYRADPVGYDASTRCHKVHEKAWEDGRLVRDEIKEVCESEKTEPRY